MVAVAPRSVGWEHYVVREQIVRRFVEAWLFFVRGQGENLSCGVCSRRGAMDVVESRRRMEEGVR